jgi:hypothetical protein
MALTKQEQLELEQLKNDPELKHLFNQDLPAENKVETSMPEALARSAAQGLAFDAADEIGAFLESATSSKPYKQALEESRAEYKKSEKEYPITSALGGLGGGMAQAALITGLSGGTAAPAEAAAVAGKGSKALQLLRSALVPTVGEGALANIASAGKVGATMGGLTALGASEREGLERIKDVPTGVAIGGIGGATIGGALEGLGATGRAIGKSISEKADQGKLPEIFKVGKTSVALGKEGIGFVTPENKATIRERAVQAAESVMPQINSKIQEVATLKNKILDNIPAPQRANIVPEIKLLIGDLRKLGRNKANKAADEVESLYLNRLKELTDAQKTLTLGDWHSLSRDIDEILANKKIMGMGKAKGLRAKYGFTMKNKIESSVDTETALASLTKDTDALDLYSKYIKQLEPKKLLNVDEAEEVAGVLGESLKGMGGTAFDVTKEDTLQKAQYLYDLVDSIKKIAITEDKSISEDLIRAEIKNVLNNAPIEVIENSNPLKKVNDLIYNLSSGSEFLGIKRKKDVFGSDLKSFEEFKKIFRNVLQLSSDKESNEINKKAYDKAMEYLSKNFPDMADNIRKSMDKAIDEIQALRYTQQGSLDAPLKEAGVIKSALGNIGQYMITGANLAAQTVEAASKGTAGPIFGTSIALRPGVSGLTSLKSTIDSFPEGRIKDTLLKIVNQALNEKDAGRRAAMMNVLMQYSPIRKIMKERQDLEKQNIQKK